MVTVTKVAHPSVAERQAQGKGGSRALAAGRPQWVGSGQGPSRPGVVARGAEPDP